MKYTEMRALSNQGGTRTALERASAWLLSHLEAGSCLDAAGWVSARAIEVARFEDRREPCRAEPGAPMVTANRRHRETASRLPRPVDVSRGGLDVQALSGVWCSQRWCRRRSLPSQCRQPSRPSPRWRSATLVGGPCTIDELYGTGLIWHGPGDIQPLADIDKARRMAQNHPGVYELVEVESD